MPKIDTVCESANGELINTLPEPKEILASLKMPPAAAIHNNAMVKKTPKYTQVEMRERRVFSSKRAIDRVVLNADVRTSFPSV